MSQATDLIRAAIWTHFSAGWATGAAGVLLVAPGQSYTPTAQTEFVRYTFAPMDVERITLTGNRSNGQRHSGMVMIQVFTPMDTGDGRAMQLADVARSLLNERALGTSAGWNVYLRQAYALGGGFGTLRSDQTPSFYQININAPWEAWETV